MSDKPTCAVRGAIRPGAMCSRILVGGELCGFAGECEHKIEPAEPMCQCGDRPANQCPEPWEPGCDLGNNAAHVRVHGITAPAEGGAA